MNSRYLNVLRTGLLVGDVSPDRRFRNRTDAAYVIAAAPERRHARFEPRKFFSKFVRRESFELGGNMRGSQSRVGLNEHVNVIRHNFQRLEIRFEFLRLLVEQLTKSFFNRSDKHLETILGTPDQVVFERVDRANTDAISGIHHETSVAQKLDICKQINREIASLCPLKRAVLCGFESMETQLGNTSGFS